MKKPCLLDGSTQQLKSLHHASQPRAGADISNASNNPPEGVQLIAEATGTRKEFLFVGIPPPCALEPPHWSYEYLVPGSRDWKNITAGRRIRYWHPPVGILVYHVCSGRYFGIAPVLR
jgi:hypothetical protein